MRIALVIEYDGSGYHGWQAQTGLRTVQQVLETALSQVADEKISVVCAGRTDTGVHAIYQVVHFDCTHSRPIRGFVHGTNSYLPQDVCVRWGGEVLNDFHARYSALSRCYRYVIYNAAIRPALQKAQVSWQYRYLNEQWMHQAGQVLIGELDFSSFRSTECQSNTPMRNVQKLSVARQGDYVIIDIQANAFLHHMVRNIAGVLMTVGAGKQPIGWVADVLKARDRKLGAETASPYGLYLTHVNYDKKWSLNYQVSNMPFLIQNINN